MKRAHTTRRLNIFSPEIFLPAFVAAFYLAGLVLVQFSLRALLVVATGIAIYLAVTMLTGRFIDARGSDMPSEKGFLPEGYFERLLLSLLIVFLVDLVLKGALPITIRAPLYLVLISGVFLLLSRVGSKLTGLHYLALGLVMILVYVVPAFARYGLYGAYLNRTGGLMPAFLVGMGTITTIYGLLKIASGLTKTRLFVMIGCITLIAGPLMAAIIGYRAYAIIYIMPLLFQYYLERKPAYGIKEGGKAAAVIIAIFLYTYFATSVARGVIYATVPLDTGKAPDRVAASMKAGHYTDKDMTWSNKEARQKFITRPLFTYNVFLDVLDRSYPWGTSHGKLTLSLMPGITKGRATTISILKKPLSTSFFGLSFLEFGFAGVALYAALLGFCLAVLTRLKDLKVYALVLTIIMLWLDTGPSVWWHWLPFVSAAVIFIAALSVNLIKPKIAGS
ncbi:MAG: hypothetical protein ACYC56_01930 [Candidatus Aquicultor sp.]